MLGGLLVGLGGTLGLLVTGLLGLVGSVAGSLI